MNLGVKFEEIVLESYISLSRCNIQAYSLNLQQVNLIFTKSNPNSTRSAYK